MPNVEPEHNLLFGLLALHLDFIDRETLINSVGSWVADKSTSLDRILRTQCSIDDETQLLLHQLARKRAVLKESSPSRLSFTTTVIESVREDLSRFHDSDIQESLTRLRDADRTGGDTYATRYTEAWQTFETSAPAMVEARRFRLLRLHAKGGLGDVFIARDEQLHRDVALKQLQDRHADRSESRLRFLLEAEVTGSLEHPGIVPVYGLGRYTDGRPYYAMRFVDGSSLQESIDTFHKTNNSATDPGTRAVEFRKLLRRFQDVCNTVAFAHSRGVIHRDIKPSNIMLGRFGETLVVDWGLAKTFIKDDQAVSASQSSSIDRQFQTLVGAPIGTPAYMSPEQAAGQIDRLGPASDIYSLGATLYHLLTGRTSIEGDDLSLMIDRVRRGQFPPPQRIERSISPALGMICMKAMALNPENRYPTPESLANDIDHWLAGEPVSVYQDWFPKRIWRWGRVHPWVVGSVGVLTFLVIIFFLLSAFVLAIPGMLLAVIGGLIGSLAGAFRGEVTRGARQGSALAFRIGIAVGAVLFLLGIGYEAVIMSKGLGPGLRDSRPNLEPLDGYRLAASRWNAGDKAGANAWFDWADRESRKSPDTLLRPEIDRARVETRVLLNRSSSLP